MAVVLALTIPDICGALTSPDGTSNGSRYKDWYAGNLAPKYPSLTANDCYKLRCGVVHQARLCHTDMQYSRVAFTVPNSGNKVFHNIITNDDLNLGPIRFCRHVTHAARSWYAAHRSDPDVRANLPYLVRFRLDGIRPHIFGLPLIA